MTKISELPNASTPTGAETLPVVQSSATRKLSLSSLLSWLESQLPGGGGGGGGNAAFVDKGTVNAGGSVSFNVGAASMQRLQVGGALSVAFTGWAGAGEHSSVMVELVNGGAAAVTWPAGIRWVSAASPGYASDLAGAGVTLHTAGTNWLAFWSHDGGTTIWAAAR